MLAAMFVDIGAQWVSVSGWLTMGRVRVSVWAWAPGLAGGGAPAGTAAGAGCWQALSATATELKPSRRRKARRVTVSGMPPPMYSIAVYRRLAECHISAS